MRAGGADVGTGIDQNLIARWIRPDRREPGDADAYIVGTGIPVWALVGHCNANGGDIALTAMDYRLPSETVKAALAYYRRHREVINARPAANDVATTS